MMSIINPFVTRAMLVANLTLTLSLQAATSPWPAGMKTCKPDLYSTGPLAFGPEGILFVADAKSAAIVAIATGDTKAASGMTALKVEALNQKLAGLLGTAA